jgi:hypothetical protein
LRGGGVAEFKVKVNGIEGGNKIRKEGFDFKMEVSGESSRCRGMSMFYEAELCGLFMRMMHK